MRIPCEVDKMKYECGKQWKEVLGITNEKECTKLHHKHVCLSPSTGLETSLKPINAYNPVILKQMLITFSPLINN